METQNGIPVIDLNNIPGRSNCEPSIREELELQLNQILETHGYCYLKNHGVISSVFDNIYEKSKKLFQLPKSEQLKYEKKGDKGTNYGGFYISNKQPFRQRYDFMNNMSPTTIPEVEVPGLTEAVESYRHGLDNVAQFLIASISSALKVTEENELINFHRGSILRKKDVESNSHVSTIIYHEITDGKNEFLMNRHTDFTSLTLLASSAPGLQVEVPMGRGNENEGKWIDADPKQDWIFLHVGDLLERFTAGKYVATVHRVKHCAQVSSGRQSLPYFLHPDYSALVKPIIECSKERAERYYPILASDYWKMQMEKRSRIVRAFNQGDVASICNSRNRLNLV